MSACSAASNSTSSGSTSPHRGSSSTIAVASTLGGHDTLPRRIIWRAIPSIPADRIREVDFLIDGRLAWVEYSPPYIFGGDDNGTNRGYLVTSWLAPGPHVFVARAVDFNGRTASNTVTARVLPAPQPPTALRGLWTRTVTARDIANAGPLDGPPPAGRWELAFDRIGAWELDPLKEGLADEISVRGDRLTIYVPINSAPFADGRSTTTAYRHHDLGGTDCTPAGPLGTYRWSRSGNTLTLTVVHEACRGRDAVWGGVWTRVSRQVPATFRP
ncbi:MAG: hypothetical protein ACXVHJ_20235 [Solirubrobacteraceae bacterium]